MIVKAFQHFLVVPVGEVVVLGPIILPVSKHLVLLLRLRVWREVHVHHGGRLWRV